MSIPVSKVKKWTLRIALILLAMGLIYSFSMASILAFPLPAFPHRLDHANFAVYSDQEFQPDFRRVLDDVSRRLQAMELYRPELNHRVFLCQSKELYGFFASLVGLNPNSQGLNVNLVGSIYLSSPFIETMRSRFGTQYRHSILEGNLAHVLAHEIAHTYIGEELGFLVERKLPRWKREGYAEYSAARAGFNEEVDFSFADRIAPLLDPSFLSGQPVRRNYYQAQQLVTFLSEIKGMDFKSIMHLESDEAELMAEMKRWCAERKVR